MVSQVKLELCYMESIGYPKMGLVSDNEEAQQLYFCMETSPMHF